MKNNLLIFGFFSFFFFHMFLLLGIVYLLEVEENKQIQQEQRATISHYESTINQLQVRVDSLELYGSTYQRLYYDLYFFTTDLD